MSYLDKPTKRIQYLNPEITNAFVKMDVAVAVGLDIIYKIK